MNRPTDRNSHSNVTEYLNLNSSNKHHHTNTNQNSNLKTSLGLFMTDSKMKKPHTQQQQQQTRQATSPNRINKNLSLRPNTPKHVKNSDSVSYTTTNRNSIKDYNSNGNYKLYDYITK